MRNNPSAFFSQEGDIYISDWDEPIFDLDTPFKGTFDGNERVISGEASASLFGSVENATLRNIRLRDYILTAEIHVMEFTKISFIAANTVSSVFDNIAITGATAELSGDDFCFGGISASDEGSIFELCYVNADVNISGGNITSGLIVGEMQNGNITESAASGSITVTTGITAIIGGLAGTYDGAEFINNYSLVDVTLVGGSSSSAVGGLVGTFGEGEITYTYYSGTIVAPRVNSSNLGGIAGFVGDNGRVTHSFYLATHNNRPIGNNHGNPRTADRLRTDITFVGWDLEIWIINEGQLPGLVRVIRN
jgi:hypothetical protein